MALLPIGDIVKKMIEERKWDDRFRVQTVWDLWDEVVGEAVAREARPRGFSHGCLRVDVSDPMWMHHLQMSVETIRRNLNNRLGSELIREIRLSLSASIHRDAASPQNTPPDGHK